MPNPRHRSRTATSGLSAEQLLADFPPRVRQVALAARRFVRRTAPTATERVYSGWRALGYRDAQSGYFCGIFPQSDHVRLLFEHGAALPDPKGLLEGATKQVRWVVLRKASDVSRPGVRELVHAALLYGATQGR